jgi:hypothetical protein
MTVPTRTRLISAEPHREGATAAAAAAMTRLLRFWYKTCCGESSGDDGANGRRAWDVYTYRGDDDDGRRRGRASVGSRRSGSSSSSSTVKKVAMSPTAEVSFFHPDARPSHGEGLMRSTFLLLLLLLVLVVVGVVLVVVVVLMPCMLQADFSQCRGQRKAHCWHPPLMFAVVVVVRLLLLLLLLCCCCCRGFPLLATSVNIRNLAKAFGIFVDLVGQISCRRRLIAIS